MSDDSDILREIYNAPVTVTCKHCNGSGSVPDVSEWPPTAPCPGCKGAGVHLLQPESPA